MLSRLFIQRNKASIAIVLFLIFFSLFHYMKPNFAYGPDGEFREFGVGYKNKTVLPVWIIAIVLAVLSYLSILAYLRYNF